MACTRSRRERSAVGPWRQARRRRGVEAWSSGKPPRVRLHASEGAVPVARDLRACDPDALADFDLRLVLPVDVEAIPVDDGDAAVDTRRLRRQQRREVVVRDPLEDETRG